MQTSSMLPLLPIEVDPVPVTTFNVIFRTGLTRTICLVRIRTKLSPVISADAFRRLFNSSLGILLSSCTHCCFSSDFLTRAKASLDCGCQ
jgi:hypothetical protein